MSEYPLAAGAERRHEPTTVRVANGVAVGRGRVALIAGPCAVEGRAPVLLERGMSATTVMADPQWTEGWYAGAAGCGPQHQPSSGNVQPSARSRHRLREHHHAPSRLPHPDLVHMRLAAMAPIIIPRRRNLEA